MDEYSENIVDYYLHPRKKGRLAGANAEASLSNPVCGDVVRIRLKISKSGRIEKAMFDGTGCAISTASASMLMEAIEGRKAAEVAKMGPSEVTRLLGIKMSPAREHCALLPLEAAKKALSEGRKRK